MAGIFNKGDFLGKGNLINRHLFLGDDEATKKNQCLSMGKK